MQTLLKLSAIGALGLTLSYCYTFDWGHFGYIEPGGNGSVAGAATTKHCTLFNKQVMADTLRKAQQENGNPKEWRDVQFDFRGRNIPPCIQFSGTPVK